MAPALSAPEQSRAADITRLPHVLFVTGDHAYSGEETLPLLAAELEKCYGMRATGLNAFPDQNAEENIPRLEALATADLAVFALRWRRLPPDQVARIEAYVNAGKPVMGFRTTSYAFCYPESHPLAHRNAWAADTFGAPPGWGGDGHTHYSHQSSTDASVATAPFTSAPGSTRCSQSGRLKTPLRC